MLVSVHVPKTGGQSFKRTLRTAFRGRFLRDVHPGFLFRPFKQRLRVWGGLAVNGFRPYRGIRCIHGHFPPLKYRALKAFGRAVFVTWMRDPIERLASLYHHVKRNNPDRWRRPLRGAPSVRNRMLAEGWSLERFVAAPELRNLYCRTFRGFPLERFDFIGITEHFEDDLAFFSDRFLGEKAAPHRLNVNPDRADGAYVQDPGVRARLEAFHAEDMNLYRLALEMRRTRTAGAASVRPGMIVQEA